MDQDLRGDRGEPGTEERTERGRIARRNLGPDDRTRGCLIEPRRDQCAPGTARCRRRSEEFHRDLQPADQTVSERHETTFIAEHAHVAPVPSRTDDARVGIEIVPGNEPVDGPSAGSTGDEHRIV